MNLLKRGLRASLQHQTSIRRTFLFIKFRSIKVTVSLCKTKLSARPRGTGAEGIAGSRNRGETRAGRYDTILIDLDSHMTVHTSGPNFSCNFEGCSYTCKGAYTLDR